MKKFILVLAFLFSENLFAAAGVDEMLSSGNIPIIQGATNETQTFINILMPRLKDFEVTAKTKDGSRALKVSLLEEVRELEDKTLWKIKKFRVDGLKLGEEYILVVQDRKILIDQRTFKAFDSQKASHRFVFGSCLTDDMRYSQVRNRIWNKVQQQEPEFLILNGDLVYVDGFEFVERKTATELQIWQRYIDSTLAIPLFRQTQLVPIYATWDDHDSGTDNADRDFQGLPHTHRVFKAFFGSADIPGFYENGIGGVNSVLSLRDQRFFLMDGRSFRVAAEVVGQPIEEYAQYGKAQTEWLREKLKASTAPAWIIMGDQFFADPVVKTSLDGKHKVINESYLANHPSDFKKFLAMLREIDAAVVFGSGDIHFSEVLSIDPSILGYQTYELTSSPFHSFIYWDEPVWENPRRVPGAVIKDHNFMLIDSKVNPSGHLQIDLAAIGSLGNLFFSKCLEVIRGH